MKNLKKIVALVIAVVMMVAMAMPVMAAEGTKTITLTGGKAGHTYTLYQVFTGTVAKVDGKDQLTSIQWGSDANATFKAAYETAAAAAKAIATEYDARASAQDWITKHYLGTGTNKTLTADGDVVFDNLPEGYYLVVDSSGPEEITDGDYYSALIVQLVKDVNIGLKASVPTSEKKVDDKNDSNTTEDAVVWQDSADYDIGDAVPFRLKATTAANVAAFKKYHITFQDNYSDGFDAPKSFSVTVLGKTLALSSNVVGTSATATTDNRTKITAEVVTPVSGQDFAIKVTFEPTAAGATYVDPECNSKDIEVTYTQVLNANAKIGAEGNPNISYILYSSNPESADDSDEGKTPEDKVIVFTYKSVIDKIDEAGAPLNGADFTLYKEVVEGTPNAVAGSSLSFADGIEHSAIKSNKFYVVAGLKTGTSAGSTYEFKGIDDGTYVLVETAVPTGFNAFESKTITVTATHDVTADDPQLLTLTATAPFTANKDAGNIEKKNGTVHAAVSGELYAEIVNQSGAVLPTTGGMGTTIFYIIGAILVIGGGILLISRRRTHTE